MNGRHRQRLTWSKRNGLRNLSIAVAAAGLVALVQPTQAATTSAVTIKPDADSYVDSAKPSSNYGTQQMLKVASSSVTYVRFVVANQSGDVTGASLQLYTRDKGASYRISLVPNASWSETTINWLNAPTGGIAVTSTAVQASGWLSVDLLGAVPGNGTYTLRVEQISGSDARFSSRESSRPPSLALVLSSSGTVTPPADPPPAGPPPTTDPVNVLPPTPDGYFTLKPPGSWSALPGDAACADQVHRSSWEPRPDNAVPNHTMPNADAVHASFATRPRNTAGSYDNRWDTWLLPRVDGQFTGTTDEIMQWAACKWGLPDNVVRSVAVRESTWYQSEVYPSGRCVTNWGCGDMVGVPDADTKAFCNELAKYLYDYQADYGVGVCPKTFSIAGVMSWQAPSWGQMAGNQNGTFPFNRDSTAFALDYLGAQLRGCYEGWEKWLGDGGGSYAAGDLWGCVGSWYAGDWHSSAGDGYTSRVQAELSNHTWLTDVWPTITPGCSTKYGCPIGRT